MAHVATYQGGLAASVSWAAGDTLVAVLGTATEGVSGPSLSGDWVLVGSERLVLGRGPSLGQAWQHVSVWTRTTTSAGSEVVRPDGMDGPGGLSYGMVVLRYSSSFVRATIGRRVQNEKPLWPASPEAAAGDVVHVGLLYAAQSPTGDTQRWDFMLTTASDRATSGVVPAVLGSARTDGMVWTIHLSSSRAAATPRLVEPAVSGVDVAAPVTVAWQPIPGQTAYSLRRMSGSTVQYWTGSTWQTGSASVSTSASSVAVPLSAGTWTLAVQVTVGGLQSAWSPGVVVVAASLPAQPSVSVSSWAVRRPTITVSGSAGAGAVRSGYQIEVVSGGVVVESTLSASGVWQPERMPDGPVVVRAAVVQSGDQQGPWREVAGTVVVPPVPAPSVVASIGYLAETAPPDGTGLPGMRLTITTSLMGVVPYEVERDGSRFLAGTLSGTHDVEDYTAGTTYRVRVGDSTSEPIEWSEWVTVAVPEGLDQTHWLIAEQYPELSVKVDHHVYGAAARNLRAQAGVYLDDDSEHITYGVPVRARRPVQIGVRSRWAWERVEALLSSGLLLRMGWCPSTDGTPTPTDVFRVAEYDPSRFIPTRNIDMWRIDFDIIPQDS